MVIERDEIYSLFEQIRPHIIEKGTLHDEGYILRAGNVIAGQMSTQSDIIIIEEPESRLLIDAEAVGLWHDGTIHNSIHPQYRKEAYKNYEGSWQPAKERSSDKLVLPRAKPEDFGVNRRQGIINLLRRTLTAVQSAPARRNP
jgi:hypothetical protein